MKKLLSPSTKAKIGAGFIALATMFGFGGCTQTTGPNGEVGDPNYVDTVHNIVFRVENVADHSATLEAVQALRTNVPESALTALLDGRALNRIIITGIGVSTSAEGPIVNGVIRGVLNPSDSLMSLIASAVGQTPVASLATGDAQCQAL